MSTQLPQEIEKIAPEEIINTLQSAYKVFQGEHDQLDDLLKNGGQLLRKVTKRFTPTQLIVGIAVVASVAVIVAARAMDAEQEEAA
ncbi:hypothetical protein DNI29_14490 [Hymenobacter sediminis]|uniref:hypothetical protein n=1 Tax=Hymenobacter sediminis TaxID=2218621 RepID=UPI000DA6B4EF|nr:hypothetical protein [Hymenobacter sediminis]RPD46210.1 hypothetical protein DNI29_14490 [Hymenobacter sediminis]